MKRVFLTFGDGGTNYVAARRRIAHEAVLTKQFDEVVEYDRSMGSQEVKDSVLWHHKKGLGYWLWKPDAIWQELKKLQEGDFLLYCDSGSTLYRTARQWRLFWQNLEQKEAVFRRISSCALHRNKLQLLKAFSSQIERGRMCFQFEATVIAIRKTRFTVRFIEEWRRFMLDHPECILMDNPDEARLPTYMENRYDQSVLTLLVYKYLAMPETASKIDSFWDFHFGIFPFGDPVILVSRQRNGAPVHLNVKDRVRRLFYRIVWQLQLFLEQRGLCVCWEKRCFR